MSAAPEAGRESSAPAPSAETRRRLRLAAGEVTSVPPSR
jgi:hypothetical protein